MSRATCRWTRSWPWWFYAVVLMACVGFAPRAAGAEADAEPVATITAPLPPPGVYRDPDWKRDFDGYRAIAHGWLSADGKTFRCIADRGEPVSFQSIREGKAKRDPVFLELDLVTRTIVREVDLPDDGPWASGSGSGEKRVVYLPASDRLVGWQHKREPVPRQTPRGMADVMMVTGWQMHALDLADPQHPVIRVYPYDEPNRPDPPWEWLFSTDGQRVWRLVYGRQIHRPKLETLAIETLRDVAATDLDWMPGEEVDLGDQFHPWDWRIDETANELWIGAAIGRDAQRALHWLRFSLADGSSLGRVVVNESVSARGGVSFSVDGRYLSAWMPSPPEGYAPSPKRYWRLPESSLAFECRTDEGGLWGAGSALVDDRYLFVAGHVSHVIDPHSERIVWRYDRELKTWSWPRKVVVPQGTAHRQYSADGSTFVAFNLIDGRQNRLAVYRFGDQERYDAELAEAMSQRQAQFESAEVEPLPEPEHTIKVSPEGEEVAVDRRALPAPEGQVLKAAASADGKRAALWMMRPDRQPKGHEWLREPIDPAIGYFGSVVIDAESGDIIRELPHPPGYTQMELHQYTQVGLSHDGRWLIIYLAKETGRRISMERAILGPVRLRVIDTESGEVVAERVAPEEDVFYFRLIDGGQRVMLRTHYQARPTVSTFEFCKLPTLETEAKMRWKWPDALTADDHEEQSVADDVRYDSENSRFIALMRDPGGWYNGNHIPTDYWVQHFDAKTMRPIRRGPVFRKEQGRGNVHMGNTFIVATYEHPELGNLMQTYTLNADNPALRIDGSAYEHGMHGYITFTEPWIAIGPGMQRNGKPGIVLVHAETGEILGPLPFGTGRSVLWISPDARRILLHPNRMDIPRDQRDTAPALEWLTVRE